MRSIDESFYHSTMWKKCRKAYKEYVGGLCERCRSKGLIAEGEIVHHKKHLTEENFKNPRVATDFNNLELLCRECHNKEHFEKKSQRYKFSDEGDLQILQDLQE